MGYSSHTPTWDWDVPRTGRCQTFFLRFWIPRLKTEENTEENTVEKTVEKKVQKMLQHFSRETLINLNRIYNVAPPLAPSDFFDTFSGFYLSLRSFLMQLGSICRFMWVVLDTVFSLWQEIVRIFKLSKKPRKKRRKKRGKTVEKSPKNALIFFSRNIDQFE